MTFKNEAQLKKFLTDKCAKAVANAEEKIYAELSGNLYQFYTEYEPVEYIRTGALLGALDISPVKRIANQHMSRVAAEVGFNVPKYQHGWIRLQSGDFGYSWWDDEYVLDVVMTDNLPHGRYHGGTAIWTKSMKALGGHRGIQRLLRQELKKQGL